ncbi:MULTISPECIES: hypothetical protein [unclassified Rhizobium]|uniref:hypothetical protein n=1 Tax=unclassified Rhizobium TaxID=2613769 RepID=UPI00288B7FFA|nr:MULTISPECIES: hypothetical protein [unclassified Rhizobium]
MRKCADRLGTWTSEADVSPDFYPILSFLKRFWVAVFGAVAAGCGAEPIWLRSISSHLVTVPASCSFKLPMICLSVKRLLFVPWSSQWARLYSKWIISRGQRHCPLMSHWRRAHYFRNIPAHSNWMTIDHEWWQRCPARYAKDSLFNFSKSMVLRMTDQDSNKTKRPPAKNDFDTLKLIATGLEEKRVSGDREKTKLLKAARLKKIEDE